MKVKHSGIQYNSEEMLTRLIAYTLMAETSTLQCHILNHDIFLYSLGSSSMDILYS